MLTYFRGGYNDYTIRVETLPSQSTHLGLTLQDMTTQENYGAYLNPGQWSYSKYESFVSFSIDLDTVTQGESIVGNELRMTLFPAFFPSGSQVLQNLPVVWHGSVAFFEGQTEKKTEYVNQIPLPESGVSPYTSETSDNTFIILQ